MPGLSRFVYSPKVWAYVKRGSGSNEVIDLTGYLVSGEVVRNLDAVSSAQLTIRNPHRMWTDYKGNRATPAFRPMDPVTIFMMRDPSRPIQTFTGYLDRTPYYQLYPGTVTLYASCTLKRLQYTFFDAGLPYMYQFLAQYGWLPNSATGTIVNVNAEMQKLGDTNGTFTDSGIGKLLYGTLEQIGKWGQDDIYIEALPPGVPDYLATVFRTFQDSNQQSISDYKTLLEQYIGVGGQGAADSGTTATDIPDYNGALNKIFPAHFIDQPGVQLSPNQVYSLAEKAGLPAKAMTQIAHGESDYYPGVVQRNPGDNNVGYGLWQITPNAWGNLGAAPSIATLKAAGGAAAYLAKLGGVDAMRNPWLCALMAKYLFDSAGGLSPWYGTKYLTDDAKAEAESGNYRHIRPTGTAPRDSGVANNPGTPTSSTSSSSKTSFPHNSKNSGHGSFVQSAVNSGPLRAYTENFAHQLFNLGFSCTSANDGTHSSSASLHYRGRALDWGDSVNDLAQLVTILWPIRKDLAELWIPPGYNHTGFYSHGVLGGSDNPAHIHVGLDKNVTLNGVSSDGGGGTDSTGATGTSGSPVGAAAFAAQVVLPGVEDTATSLLLQGQKSLMNDKPLLPFVQQLTGASLRRFQSLPNGQFFAFYPDYFGEFTDNKLPYWEIDDVEILDGTIELTDDNVVTHEYVVGETIPLSGGIGLPEMLQSSGVVTVFNAFGNSSAPGFIKSANESAVKTPNVGAAADKTKSKQKSPDTVESGSGNQAAIEFLQRYGARPDLNEAPMIRSPYFELLLAWQRFMLAWSQQFLTEFTFTFMPELYPGGKVGFKNHGIQCFIESVTHTFDMEAGFTTTAQLSAASAYGSDQPALEASLVSNPF